MFTKEELNNLGIFMSRCELKGNESLAHAFLMQKIQQLITPQPVDKPEKFDEVYKLGEHAKTK